MGMTGVHRASGRLWFIVSVAGGYGKRPALLRKFFSLIYTILCEFTQIVTGIEVLIGLQRVDQLCAPLIENNVDIRAGAKMLGTVSIGKNVAIVANVAVAQAGPDNSIASGVPAAIEPREPEGIPG